MYLFDKMKLYYVATVVVVAKICLEFIQMSSTTEGMSIHT